MILAIIPRRKDWSQIVFWLIRSKCYHVPSHQPKRYVSSALLTLSFAFPLFPAGEYGHLFLFPVLKAGPGGNMCCYVFLNVRISRCLPCYLHCGTATPVQGAVCTSAVEVTLLPDEMNKIREQVFLPLYCRLNVVILGQFDKWTLTRPSLHEKNLSTLYERNETESPTSKQPNSV